MFLCGDDPGICEMMKQMSEEQKSRVSLYGLSSQHEFYADDIQYHCGGGVCYNFYARGRLMGAVELVVSGRHNVLDSLAACSVSAMLNIPFEAVQKALRMFHGAKRRLQLRSMCPENILVYDDYGHHPNEIAATLDAVQCMYPDRRVILAFQPHRYTRTQALFDRFAQVLSTVPRVVLLPVYAADEQPIPGVSSEMICEEVIRLQEMLRDLGYYSGSIRSGQFGSMTGSAVAKFQKANGLPATQVADPGTIAQIETAWKALGQQAAQTAQEQAGN